MRTRHFSLALFATVLLFTVGASWAASYAPGKSKPAPGAEIFDNRHVLPLRIEIAPNEWKALQRDNRKHVRATVREGTNVWKDVGVHVKGAAGSTRDLNDKPALTLAFAKFTPGQRFHGLRKLTEQVLEHIRYLNKVSTSMRAGLLLVDEAAAEIDATEQKLHEMIGQLRHFAGVTA